MPRAVGIGSFNRVPNGPRGQHSPACFPTRGALPTRLNECAILNRARHITCGSLQANLKSMLCGFCEFLLMLRGAVHTLADERRTRRLVVVALSELDRGLLQCCLAQKPRAWENFVDRFLGLVVHVVNHSASCRSIRITAEDRNDLVAEVFLTIVNNDFAVLRRFSGRSSLATYLTVIARRVVVRELLKRKTQASLSEAAANDASMARQTSSAEERISNREQVEQLLRRLQGPEAEIIRMYHLEGKSYREISSSVGLPENSIGPTLSRARAKLRQAGVDAAGN